MGIIKCDNIDCGKPYDDSVPHCPFCHPSGRKVRSLGKADDDGVSFFNHGVGTCPYCGEEDVPGTLIRVSQEKTEQIGWRDTFYPDQEKHKCKAAQTPTLRADRSVPK